MVTEGKKRVRKSPEERKREIIAAAGKLIGEKGYYGTSLKDIADAIGMSQPGLRTDDFSKPLGAGHRQRIPVAEFDEVLQTHVVEVRGDHMVDLVRVELAVRIHVVRVLVERRMVQIGSGHRQRPGGQLETSIGILHKPEELATLYGAFRREVDPILEELGFRLVNYGYQPKSSYADIPVNPKDRYKAMTAYLGRVGQFGPCMMRCSASTQVSIDYVSEQDAISKLRLGTVVGPILAWFFRNTPYFEGQENPYPLLRQRMWDYLDLQRTNVIPGLFDPRFGWEDYAVDVLSTPMMFADLTHTPEALETPGTDLHHPAFYENANDVYPDRELNAYEINHVISTHFNDVRLKNFIEFRHWDSLPVARAERLTEIIGSLFYDPTNRERLESYFDGIREEDVFEAKANLQARGYQAAPYGNSLEFWQEFLGLEGVLADEPGDPKHPDVFQK